MKIQFLSTNFVKKLHEIDEYDDKVDQNLLQYYNHDLVLLPFFFDRLDQKLLDPTHECEVERNSDTGIEEYVCGCSSDKRAVLVSVKVLDNQVDLFDIEFRDHENHDISNSVLHIMDNASNLHNIELNEELIDADMENIQGVQNDEDMLVAMCYIAECFTFGREPDLENNILPIN